MQQGATCAECHRSLTEVRHIYRDHDGRCADPCDKNLPRASKEACVEIWEVTPRCPSSSLDGHSLIESGQVRHQRSGGARYWAKCECGKTFKSKRPTVAAEAWGKHQKRASKKKR